MATSSTEHDAFLVFTETVLENTAKLLNPCTYNDDFNLSNDEFNHLEHLTVDTTITINPLTVKPEYIRLRDSSLCCEA